MLPTALRLALRPLREAVTPSILPQPPELLLSPLKAVKKAPRSKRLPQKSIQSKKKDEKDLRWWLSQKHPEVIFHVCKLTLYLDWVPHTAFLIVER